MVKRTARKSEIQNPKSQSPNTKIRKQIGPPSCFCLGLPTKTRRFAAILVRISDLFRVSTFGFGISGGLCDRSRLRLRPRSPNNPIAIIKPVQVMGVESVPEVRAEFHRPGGW